MGLISTGTGYKNRALSGFLRASATESQIKGANEELKAAKTAQKKTMIGQGAGLGLMAGLTSAKLGAMAGSWAGPAGMVGGAALGFLFSELF